MPELTPLDGEFSELPDQNFTDSFDLDVPAVPLRDEVLERIGSYCSDLGQDLWAAYCADVIPSLLAKEWNMNLQFEFLKFKRQLDTKGLASSGDIILHRLKELASDD